MIALSPAAHNTITLVDPEAIQVDAATYQFRSGADAKGIIKDNIYKTDRWNVILHSNPILVHERFDGNMYVADGHHRLDLAKRSNATGHGPGQIAAIVLKESDGYTAEDVRVIAAFRNMRWGHVDAVDGARVFKEVKSGAVHTALLPPLQMDKGNLTLSYRLSGLSDAALDKVQTKAVTPEIGALVADRIVDPSRQEAVINLISYKLQQKYDPERREFRGTVSTGNKPLPGFATAVMQQRQSAATAQGRA